LGRDLVHKAPKRFPSQKPRREPGYPQLRTRGFASPDFSGFAPSWLGCPNLLQNYCPTISHYLAKSNCQTFAVRATFVKRNDPLKPLFVQTAQRAFDFAFILPFHIGKDTAREGLTIVTVHYQIDDRRHFTFHFHNLGNQ